MLSLTGSKIDLEKKDYYFEPKLDGIRALCYKNKDKFEFISRNNKSLTLSFPQLTFAKNILAESCVLDGEIVYFDEKGISSFSLLQNRGNKFFSDVGKNNQVVFVVFDILKKEEVDLTSKPLFERKKILSETVLEGQNIKIGLFFEDGKKLWEEIVAKKMEGVMAKKKDSVYVQDRSKYWLKIKLLSTIDAVIIGFIQGKRIISSLALGLYENEELKYIGNVGTGFTDSQLNEIFVQLNEIKESKGNIVLPKEIIQVQPKLVCEVRFLEVTKEVKLRAPVFVRLRLDKNPKDCTTAQFAQAHLPVNNLQEYEKKRNFLVSPEPNSLGSSGKTPIFVIQKHNATRIHFDFRLEHKGVLLSWAIPKGISQIPEEKRLAIMTEPHPLSYANFQGTIPKGEYGAGTVELWDKGKFVNITLKEGKVLPLSDAIEKGHFTIYLEGEKNIGTFNFIRIKDKNWLVLKKSEPKESYDIQNEFSLVKFTNLTKELDEGIKKQELVEYYAKIFHLMFPHIKNRPISMLRFPDGVDGKKFFQKNVPEYFKLKCKKIKEVCYSFVEKEEDIIYLANQVVEIHLMASTVDEPQKPDKLVFDLDPSFEDLKSLKELALIFKKTIETTGLYPFIMTTGGKGFHIVVPIKQELFAEQVRDFALKISLAVIQSNPKKYTSQLIKEKREGRIFIDVNRLSLMQTSIAPYSVRAKKGLPIACPFPWDELPNISPQTFTIRNYPRTDAWSEFNSKEVSLISIIENLSK